MYKNRLTLTGIVLFLVTLSAGAQTGEAKAITDNSYEFFTTDEEIRKAVDHMANLISENNIIIYRLREANNYAQWGSEKDIQVFEDRIEIGKRNAKFVFPFKDIINSVTFPKDVQGNVRVFIGDFHIYIKGEGNGQKFKDDLLFLKKQNDELFAKKISEKQDSGLKEFEPLATLYRSLKVKPPVSEEQRKYIVQANSFNQKKDFAKAIELYLKAIEIDQTAYPAAYSNLALLSAQISKFSDAIFYMKKYLLLEPEAPDSRGARDKIYEWEAEIVK